MAKTKRPEAEGEKRAYRTLVRVSHNGETFEEGAAELMLTDAEAAPLLARKAIEQDVLPAA